MHTRIVKASANGLSFDRIVTTSQDNATTDLRETKKLLGLNMLKFYLRRGAIQQGQARRTHFEFGGEI